MVLEMFCLLKFYYFSNLCLVPKKIWYWIKKLKRFSYLAIAVLLFEIQTKYQKPREEVQY